MSYEVEIVENQKLKIKSQFVNAIKKKINQLIGAIPDRVSGMLVSEYIQNKRIMPLNSPIPGLVDLTVTPWIIEIIDNFSANSPITWVISMKAAQVAMTFGMECCIVYHIGEYPADQMFASGSGDLLDTWSNKRLNPAIDSCGLRPLIRAQTENRKSRRTGDTILKKEYPAGFLNMVSLGSGPQLRQDSVKRLWRDEIDEAPVIIKGQGSPFAISDARLNAYGDRAKKWDNSTPTDAETSVIYKFFKMGDQREFFLPCPHCGESQYLQWGERDKFGIQYEKKDGILVEGSVWYRCIKNGCKITEAEKHQIVKNGKWKPTAKSRSKRTRSYHINSFYAPPGQITWSNLVEKWLNSQDDPEDLKTFVNLFLGEPWNQQGDRPKLKRLIALRGNYPSGAIPEGVIFLTAAVDVQRGKKGDKKHPPRLEIEVCGHGSSRRTWSISYFQIVGSIDDANDGAWQKLREHIENGGFSYKTDDGKLFEVAITVIDCGDGQSQGAVYQFAQSGQGIYPIEGLVRLKNVKKYYEKKVNSGLIVIQSIVNYYKNNIYANLNILRNQIGEQRPGFCEFPADYPDNYFEMLRAEERFSDGTFHLPSGRRNEALDLRGYNLTAADVYIDNIVKKQIESAKKRKVNPVQIEKINRALILKQLKKIVEN